MCFSGWDSILTAMGCGVDAVELNGTHRISAELETHTGGGLGQLRWIDLLILIQAAIRNAIGQHDAYQRCQSW